MSKHVLYVKLYSLTEGDWDKRGEATTEVDLPHLTSAELTSIARTIAQVGKIIARPAARRPTA